MDKYKVKINHRAIRELNAIYDYIAKEKSSPEYAKKAGRQNQICYFRFKAHFLNLIRNVNTGKYAGKGYRQLLIDNYVAVFKN